MSNLTDKLLRFVGYAIAVILFLVTCIVIYIVLTFINNPKLEKQDDQEPLSNMEQDLQKELNKSGEQHPLNAPLNNFEDSSSHSIGQVSEQPAYPDNNAQQSGSNPPSEDIYNPFEDSDQPVVQPDSNQRPKIEELQKPEKGNNSAKPIDPTNKNQQPNLDALF